MKTNTTCINNSNPFISQTTVRLLLLIFLSSFSLLSFAQTEVLNSVIQNGEDEIQKNDAGNPCITAVEYASIEKRCAENVKRLHIDNSQQKIMLTTSLNWPLQPAANLTDCGYYFIGAYVDENTTAGVFSDWNCGTHTYDGHGGTDIAIWPFSFNKVDSSSVEVIAAAPGTIIDKHDGEFDRNCVGAGSGLPANYVIIQHADGSWALYWHMKQNSITSKAIGQTVVVGEHLGVVASSGSSSGPHLHFEVWAGNTSNTRVDPYYGSCNLLNASSWWASQKPASEPAILKASVHITDYVPATCPNSDTTNESTSYALPFNGPGMPTDFAKFFIYLRDVAPGSTANLSILNPNGSTNSSWNYTFTSAYTVCYAGWSKHLPMQPGVCTFQATYNGITCSQNFTISSVAGISESANLSDIVISPNPSHGFISLNFSGNIKAGNISVCNVLGETTYEENILNETKKELNLTQCFPGIYFLKIFDGEKYYNRKIIVE